jgi:hypothetical protein
MEKESGGYYYRHFNLRQICVYQYERGIFSIPLEYYEAFHVLGSIINGTDAILFKWAEFFVQASGQTLSTTQVLNEALKIPVNDRDIPVQKDPLNRRKVRCVWSSDKISRYDIDHIIPFNIWKITTCGTYCPQDRTLTTKNATRYRTPRSSRTDWNSSHITGTCFTSINSNVSAKDYRRLYSVIISRMTGTNQLSSS